MRSSRHRGAKNAAVLLALLGLWSSAGCGPGGPKTYPVRGKIELAGGNVEHLAGSTIEAALESDTTVRAAGSIEPNGSFTLETLYAGVLRKGALAGNYKARIIPTEDGDAKTKRLARAAVHSRFLQFHSDLSFQVPAQGEVVLKVAPR